MTDWLTVLRAAETLRFTRAVLWGEGLWFVEFPYDGGGWINPLNNRLCRDIVIEGDRVWTKADADV